MSQLMNDAQWEEYVRKNVATLHDMDGNELEQTILQLTHVPPQSDDVWEDKTVENRMSVVSKVWYEISGESNYSFEDDIPLPDLEWSDDDNCYI